MTQTQTAEILPIVSGDIVEYNPFKAQLAELIDKDKTMQFDYESKAGDKEARSYVYALKRTKSAVEEARKKCKAHALEYGKKVDAGAKEIMEPIQKIIDRHEAKIKEVEEREKLRTAQLETRYSEIVMLGKGVINGQNIPLKMCLETLQDIQVDASFQEFEEEARRAKDAAIESLTAAIKEEEQREADRLELERLRQAEADRKAAEEAARAEKERLEREEQIRKDAEAKAQKEAEEREALLKKQAEDAQREKEEAIAKAERDKKDAEEREAKRIEDEARREEERKAEQARREEQARLDQEAAVAAALKAENDRREKEEADKKAAEEKRAADEAHKMNIHYAIRDAIAAVMRDDDAGVIVEAIAEGKIPYVTISY